MGSGDITKDYDRLDRVLAELAELRVIMNGFGNDLSSVKTNQASVKTELASVKTELASVKTELASVNTRLDSVETRLTSVETRMTSLETRNESLESRFDVFEAKVEKRLLETTPLWVKKLLDKIDNVHSDMQKGFLELTNRVDELSVDINKMRGSQRGFDQRLDALEREQRQRL